MHPDREYSITQLAESERVSRRLSREVNVHRISPDAWAADSSDPFLVNVRERPLIQLNLDLET